MSYVFLAKFKLHGRYAASLAIPRWVGSSLTITGWLHINVLQQYNYFLADQNNCHQI